MCGAKLSLPCPFFSWTLSTNHCCCYVYCSYKCPRAFNAEFQYFIPRFNQNFMTLNKSCFYIFDYTFKTNQIYLIILSFFARPSPLTFEGLHSVRRSRVPTPNSNTPYIMPFDIHSTVFTGRFTTSGVPTLRNYWLQISRWVCMESDWLQTYRVCHYCHRAILLHLWAFVAKVLNLIVRFQSLSGKRETAQKTKQQDKGSWLWWGSFAHSSSNI
jgi:hypothetical protein